MIAKVAALRHLTEQASCQAVVKAENRFNRLKSLVKTLFFLISQFIQALTFYMTEFIGARHTLVFFSS